LEEGRWRPGVISVNARPKDAEIDDAEEKPHDHNQDPVDAKEHAFHPGRFEKIELVHKRARDFGRLRDLSLRANPVS